MRPLSANLRTLTFLRIARDLTFASAILVPFFSHNGLNLGQIMTLQAIFAFAVVLLEMPTGYLADRYGRVASLRVGQAITGAGFMYYAVADGFSGFAIAEVVIAMGLACISGADDALLVATLKAEGRFDRLTYRRVKGRMESLWFLTTALGAPAGSFMAARYGLRLPLILDGLINLTGFLVSLRLVEPAVPDQAEEPLRHPVRSMASVFRYSLQGHATLPLWLGLGTALSAGTYLGFWLAPAYLEAVGIPLAAFGAVVTGRSVFKAALAARHGKITSRVSDRTLFRLFATLNLATYALLIAFKQPVAIIALLGFDFVQALQMTAVSERVNRLVTQESIRAQVHSVAALQRRALVAATGLLAGFTTDRFGLNAGLAAGAVFTGAITWFCLVRLKTKGELGPEAGG